MAKEYETECAGYGKYPYLQKISENSTKEKTIKQ